MMLRFFLLSAFVVDFILTANGCKCGPLTTDFPVMPGIKFRRSVPEKEVNGMKNCLLNPELAVDPKDAENCKYGFEVDACGTHFCSKGPNEYCGGKFERYAICGEGLMCNKCNRCTGCSTKSSECWYDEYCI